MKTTADRTASLATTRAGESSIKADFLVVGFGAWTIFGLFLDGWAHSTQRPDSFFTPWHAVLYTGFLGAALTVLWQTKRQHPGFTWARAVLNGDRITLVGLGLFAAGGATDMIWHLLLGVEVNLEALLSPTHLLLMTGGALAFSGPFRAEFRSDTHPERLGRFVPALISLALAAGVAIFFTSYASPFGETTVATFASVQTHLHDFSRDTAHAFELLREMWAITTILFTTVLVTVPALALLRVGRPPRGSVMVLFVALGLFESAVSELTRWPLAFALVAAGVAGEFLVRRATAPLFAAGIGASLWGSYFVLVAVADTLRWSPELWGGAIVLSAGLAAAIASATRPGVPD